jgi:putative transposase
VTLARAAVLRPGDWVAFDGAEHQVVALAGTSVRLRSDAGVEQVVLAAYLMACPEFAVVDGAPLPAVEPFGLLDSLPVAVLEAAREWERHVVEVETGLPPGAEPGVTPRPGYDPAATTMVQRGRAKAAELGVSVRTVQTRRARYAQQGLWGLVDQRAARVSEAAGRADARLVAAVRELLDAETDTSTGTRSRLIRRAVKSVEATHGPGVDGVAGQDHVLQADRRGRFSSAHVRLGGDPPADRQPSAGDVHPDARRPAG